MDRSVKPGDDFYRYANGDWIKRTEIPPDSGYVTLGGWSNDASRSLPYNLALPWQGNNDVQLIGFQRY